MPNQKPEEKPSPGGISLSSEVAQPEHEQRFEEVAATVPDVILETGPDSAAADAPRIVEAGPESIPAPAAEPDVVTLPQITSLQKETVAFYLDLVFKGVATQAGKHWELDGKELAMSTEVTTPLVNKWMPLWMSETQYKEEIAFCIVMFGIVAAKSETAQRLIGQVMTLAFQKPKPQPSPGGSRIRESSVSPDAVRAFRPQ